MDEGSYPRFLQGMIGEVLSDTPIAVIQGPRQVGKSTLARELAAHHRAIVVSLDELAVRDFAREDPVGFVAQGADSMLVIDEAQRVPELILPVKASVDRDRRPGRFLLTGSADLLKVKGIADSLAGRAETVELLPLSQGELGRRHHPEDFVSWLLAGEAGSDFEALDTESVIRGGFPEPLRRKQSRARAWFLSFLTRLADHDARELREGGYAGHFASLLRVIAAGGQSELVKARLARELGVAESTIDVYLQLAKTMRLVVEIPGWNRAQRGRVVRRPKICLVDTGLSAALTGFTTPMATHVGGREYFGALVEQLVTLELLKQCSWSQTPYTVFHFRDRDGLKVDLLLETDDGGLIAIEVKSTSTVTSKLWANLTAFRERFPERHVTGVLLHAGDSTATLHGWLHVLPITALWQH